MYLLLLLKIAVNSNSWEKSSDVILGRNFSFTFEMNEVEQEQMRLGGSFNP